MDWRHQSLALSHHYQFCGLTQQYDQQIKAVLSQCDDLPHQILLRVQLHSVVVLPGEINGQEFAFEHLGPLLLTWINFNPSMDK